MDFSLMDQRSETTMTLDPTTENDGKSIHSVIGSEQLRCAQINQIYSQTLLGGFAAFLGSAVLAASLWNSIGHILLIAWISFTPL